MKKAQDEKIRQKQADDDEYFMEFEVMRIGMKRISDKTTKNQAKQAWNGKAWKRQSQIEAKSTKVKAKVNPGVCQLRKQQNRSKKPKLPKVGPPVPT
ncbi:hypothetical protein Tco_0642927 [Tanacetum coccineum]